MPKQAKPIPKAVMASIFLRPILSEKYCEKNKKYIPIETILPAKAIIEFCCSIEKEPRNSSAIKDGIEPGKIVTYASKICTNIRTTSNLRK